ncbi:hypothetical protein PRIPAC_90998 [Pristionchus pacificus]|uniref:Uncharacterized protein n=1 Tax=Pristionchus pacificus TaxID=54126 RepID=A0A2A6B982_PRIPA|nr:hypothetical protein PRIPAC_90998 [Pristionchus pacificus]|eukprot:PDM62428.1 hypothetical protein PRIPAC_51870 [Pristionchus pacificus]
MEVVLETDTLSPVSRPDTSFRIRKFVKTIESNSKSLERRISAKITDPRITVAKQDHIEFTFFQGPLSFLSPSFRASITIGNKTFRSAEQNFDARKWDEIAPDVMALAQYHNSCRTAYCVRPFLRQETAQSYIVIDSTQSNLLFLFSDLINTHIRWGCGLTIGQNPTDVTTWKGENIIGKILTLLREHIKSADCNLFVLG